MFTVRILAALAGMAALLCACPVEVPAIDEQVFSCGSDDECAPGHDCLGGRCVAEGQDAGLVTLDAARTDLASSDLASSDLASSDLSFPDLSSSDLSSSDLSSSDLSSSDQAPPDTLQPDALLPDTSQPDTSQPDTASASCDELYGAVPGYILCWETDDRCAFNAEMYAYPGRSCGELCPDFGGVCLDGIDNPNDVGRECEEGGSDGCDSYRGTELCVCNRY